MSYVNLTARGSAAAFEGTRAGVCGAPCRGSQARAEGHRGVGKGGEGACEHRSGQPPRRAPLAASFPRNDATGREARGADRLSGDAWEGGARTRERKVRGWQGLAHRRLQASQPAQENTAAGQASH